MRTIDAALAVSLMVASIGLWQVSEPFPGTAAIFPRVVLVVLATLGALLLIQTRRRAYDDSSGHEGVRGGRAMLRPFAAFALSIGTVWLMGAFGFFPAIVVFSAALFLLLSVGNRRLYFLTVAVLLVFVYLVFAVVLGVPLVAEG